LPQLSQPSHREVPEPRFASGPGGASGVVDGFLGVDVGSVSTNLVVLDSTGEKVLDGIYLSTRGRPVEVLAEGLAELRARFGRRLRLLGLGSTGSGRHLAAGLLGADVVQNEISCQLASALHHHPGTDTVIEIGGQDSKFIRAQEGRLVDFTMNKICAAGTGSFLEEEAQRLGVSIVDEFARLALSAERPPNLGCRCTVFVDTEVVNALAREEQIPDLCAGLAYAIARNYLERVVEGRPVGRHVVMQGGVASNRAVVAAFAQLLGQPVHVHPHGRISGAIGAALAARQWARARQPEQQTSAFRGFDVLESNRAPEVQTFECVRCENRCQVSRISVPTLESAKARLHFGDACERYAARDSGSSPSNNELPDLFAEREALMAGAAREVSRPRAVIGLPRASVLLGQLPFWVRLLSELGFQVRLSGRSSPATLELGSALLPAETCLPIKLSFGHVQQLLSESSSETAVNAVLIPALGQLTNWRGEGSILCPYTNGLPHMLAATLDRQRLLIPELDLVERDPAGMAEALTTVLARYGVTSARVEGALRVATAAQQSAMEQLRARGAAALSAHCHEAGPRVAVLGRPYTLGDAYLNLNLVRHLRRLGALAVPLEMLPLSDLEAGRTPWRFNRDLLRALQWLHLDCPDLHPIVLSSFGCGPDAFAFKRIGEMCGDRPLLELELDEHRAEAGLITRLEAFLDEIDQFRRRASSPDRASGATSTGRTVTRGLAECRGHRVWIPFMSDHAHAFAGAYRSAGLDAEVLPPPDDALLARAEWVSTGRECHPYTLLAADLDRVAERYRPGDLFFVPGSTLPCLIQQWDRGMEELLERKGVADLDLLNPTMAGHRDLLGLEGGFRLYSGLFAVDLLIRATCALRPYERSPGLTDALHAVNLRDLESALAGGDLGAALRRCAARLDSIDYDRSGATRPLVGVAGDIYCRINPAGNRNLFGRLERAGCEVWPAPFMVDIVEYGLIEDVRLALGRRQLRQVLHEGVMLALQQIGAWFVRRGLGSPQALVPPWGDRWRSVEALWREEPPLDVFAELARPYVGQHCNSLVRWNVAKMVDFARRGCCGIVNAVGQNCMVGTVSAAIARRIRSEHNGIPLVTLPYGSTPTDAERAALEAFIHQVKGWHARRNNPTSPRPATPTGIGFAPRVPTGFGSGSS
jgi:predicted CoA-substrate-specific enzyme activase